MSFSLTALVLDGFLNRETELKLLVKSFSDPKTRFGFTVVGKRRVGKTALLRRVKQDLEKKQLPCAYISVWDLTDQTLEEWSLKLSELIFEAYHPYISIKQKLKELAQTPLSLLRQVLPKLSVDFKLAEFISTSFALESRAKLSDDQQLERPFELLEVLAKATRKPLVLIIDEFPDLVNVKKSQGHLIGTAVIKKLRTIYERQHSLRLCVSGSIRRTMEIYCLDASSAFYRQLAPLEVKPLADKYIVQLYKKNRIKLADDGLKRLIEYVQGIPFYAQFLGRQIQQKQFKRSLRAADIDALVADFIAQEGNLLFREEFYKLSPKEKKLVLALCSQKQFSVTGIDKTINEHSSTVAKLLQSLQEKAALERLDKGVYEFTDPFFQLWLQGLAAT